MAEVQTWLVLDLHTNAGGRDGIQVAEVRVRGEVWVEGEMRNSCCLEEQMAPFIC